MGPITPGHHALIRPRLGSGAPSEHSGVVALLSWLLGGLIVGMIARTLVRGPHALGCVGTIGLGMIGSLVGGTVVNALRGNRMELAESGFFGSVLGAVLVLVLARLFGRSTQEP
jgi:uncharacterized membrane protein YeaQ/YmgE (transglycosylase-associated protein family)